MSNRHGQIGQQKTLQHFLKTTPSDQKAKLLMIISDDLSHYSKLKDIFKTNADTDLPSETGLDTAVLTDGEESERYHDN